jgi:hemerythrin-like domain-containing protein
MPRTSIQVIHDEHAALAAMLRSLLMMVDRGPGEEPEAFFDVIRAMLFYIDEFPEKLHHPMESDVLFPRVARHAPALLPVIERLERDHMKGEAAVRDLQHLLLAWELLGDGRRQPFVEQARQYVGFYLEHMRVEEAQVLPEAVRSFAEDDWKAVHAVFGVSRDPLVAGDMRDAAYNRLFTRIVMKAPSPIGVGA